MRKLQIQLVPTVTLLEAHKGIICRKGNKSGEAVGRNSELISSHKGWTSSLCVTPS